MNGPYRMPKTDSALWWMPPWPGNPQKVTRRGKPAVVVIAVEEYERLRNQEPDNTPTFVEHLLAIPKGGDFDFERWPLEPRSLDL